jgi:hypothetical protein
MENNTSAKKALPSQPSVVQNKTVMISLDSILKPLPKKQKIKSSHAPIMLTFVIGLGVGGVVFFKSMASPRPAEEVAEVISDEPKRMPASVPEPSPVTKIQAYTPESSDDGSSLGEQTFVAQDYSNNVQYYDDYEADLDELDERDLSENYTDY